MKNIKKKIIGQAAVKNTKLVPEIYTMMRSLTKSKVLSIPYQLRGQKVFKEAFHSPNTHPVVRALLLNSVLNPSFDMRLALSPYIGRHVDVNALKLSIYPDRQSLSISFSETFNISRIEPYVQEFQIAKNEHTNFMEALKTENYTNMKYSLGTYEYKHAGFALIELLRTTIKVNDIMKRYYDYDDPSEDKDYDRQETLPQRRVYQFLGDLNHLRNELGKYSRLEKYLKLDTSHIYSRLADIEAKCYEYLDVPTFDGQAQVEMQYQLFDLFVDVIRDVGDLIVKVDSMDYTQIESMVPKTFAVPKFVHYNEEKSYLYNQKVNEGTFVDDVKNIKNFFVSRRGG